MASCSTPSSQQHPVPSTQAALDLQLLAAAVFTGAVAVTGGVPVDQQALPAPSAHAQHTRQRGQENSRHHLPCLVLQEKPQGAVPEAWLAALAASGLPTTDMAADLAALLSPKDEEEVKNVKKAAYLVSNALTKFAVPQLEGGWPAAQPTAALCCM